MCGILGTWSQLEVILILNVIRAAFVPTTPSLFVLISNLLKEHHHAAQEESAGQEAKKDRIMLNKDFTE